MAVVVVIGYTGCLLSVDGETAVGMKGVGKDSTAGYMAECAADSLGFEVLNMSFADPLKDLVAKVYGLPRRIWDCARMKERPLPCYPGWTYRKFLEKVGTDVGRHFNPEIWIQLLKARIQKETSSGWSALSVPEAQLQARMTEVGLPEPVPRRLLIQVTDVRFKNEYDMLKSLGAHIIQVSRRSQTHVMLDADSHASNCFDHAMVPDAQVYNDSTLDDLKHQSSVLLPLLVCTR